MGLDNPIFYNQFHEFASPAGCGYITSRNVGIVRRLIWVVFIVTGQNKSTSESLMKSILGLFYSLYTIYKCADRFMKYPSSIKPAFKTEDVLKFPKSEIL